MKKEKREKFTMTPDAVTFDTRLKPSEVRVYLALRSYRNEAEKSPVWPTCETIRLRIGCSKDTVERSVKKLVQCGYLNYKKGSKKHGKANLYYFMEVVGSRTDAADMAASVSAEEGVHAPQEPAPVRLQSELGNQNYKPEKKLQLYHGKDFAWVKNGAIRICNYQGVWVDYGGYDDDAFCFGDLQGKEAKDAALKHFAAFDNSAKLVSLPTDDQVQRGHSQIAPSTTKP